MELPIPMTEVAFTLRRTKEPHLANQKMYLDYIGRLTKTLGADIQKVEFEETAGLHCHGIFLVPDMIDRKRFRTRGWNMELKDIDDKQGWKRYCDKDKEKPDTPTTDEEYINEKHYMDERAIKDALFRKDYILNQYI